MIGARKGVSELVAGNGKYLAPKSEIQPYTEGKSTFYANSAREVIKLGASASPFNQPHPVQETVCDNLEVSGVSVSSQDVRLQQEQYHRPVSPVPSYDVVESEEIKMVVLGNRFVGKSSVIRKTAKKNFSCQYNRTHSLKHYCKTVKLKGKLFVITFWDLPNDTLVDEAQRKEYFQGAMAAFVVYDLSNLTETLSTIVEWKKIVNNNVCLENGDPIPVYLLGNKCDMEGCQKDGASFTSDNKFAGHFRTSAKTGEGIEEAVKQAAKDIVEESYPYLPVIVETPDHLKK